MSGQKIPAVQVLGDSVLLHGPAVLNALRLVQQGVRLARERDGIGSSASIDALLDGLGRAAQRWMSESGPSDVRDEAETESFDAVEPISTQQAADLLGVTTRHVTRQALALGGRKVGNGWQFPRGVVEAARLERRQAA